MCVPAIQPIPTKPIRRGISKSLQRGVFSVPLEAPANFGAECALFADCAEVEQHNQQVGVVN
jgi:hypothetical protein